MFERFLYPSVCGFCNKILEDGYICDECKQNIKCISSEYIPFVQTSYFDILYCSYEYAEVVRKKMLDYKFNHKKYLCKTFAENMIDKLKNRTDLKYDVIIAVPTSRKRKLQRGYNQSELIAKLVAKAIKIPYEKNVIIKAKHNATQSKLGRNERIENVKNVFKITKDVNNKKVLLIDDIYTTGATVNECSKLLKKAGATNVTVFTVARATINSHID